MDAFHSLAANLAEMRRKRDQRMTIHRSAKENARNSLHKSLDTLLDKAMGAMAKGQMTAVEVSALEARANRIKAAA